MGRQLAFDRNEKLKQAMKLFWSKGYEATSMQDLVDTLGINRFSLYNTFGDKRSLFLEALQRYGDAIMRPLTEPLRQPDASLPAVARYLDNLAQGLSRPGGNFGCFMQNAVSECGGADGEVRALAAQAFRELERLLEEALQRAVRQGEVSPTLDARSGARYLVTHVQGVILLHKATRDPARLAESVQFVKKQVLAW